MVRTTAMTTIMAKLATKTDSFEAALAQATGPVPKRSRTLSWQAKAELRVKELPPLSPQAIALAEWLAEFLEIVAWRDRVVLQAPLLRPCRVVRRQSVSQSFSELTHRKHHKMRPVTDTYIGASAFRQR